MNIYTIVIIISICFSLIAISISIITIIMNTKIIKLVSPSKNNTSDNFDEDKFLNSLQFNTFLDSKIQPLLGLYSNKDIIIQVSKLAKEQYSTVKFSTEKLDKYIEDVLLLYNNPWKDETNDVSFEMVDEIYDNNIDLTNVTQLKVQDTEINSNLRKYDSINISDVLNSFYKD